MKRENFRYNPETEGVEIDITICVKFDDMRDRFHEIKRRIQVIEGIFWVNVDDLPSMLTREVIEADLNDF